MSRISHPYQVHGYTLLQPIGEGSFGVVWKALAPGDFPAAVKFISRARDDLIALPELKALQAIRSLNNPYLVKVLACWEETEWLIIAMELGDGNLRERFEQCRADGLPGIPGDELLHYTREAADALDYLHSLNKLHRDIKPENLLLFLAAPAHCKVGDCGLVRDQDRIMTMRPQGSPPYMPAEAWDCRPCPASDQFALAVTYAEMRLGRRPFGGQTVREMEDAVRMHTPDLDGLSEAEAAALRKALAHAPKDRYETCRDFVNALEEAMRTRADSYRPKAAVKLRKDLPPRHAIPSRPNDRTKPLDASAAATAVMRAPAPPAKPPRPSPRWPAAAAALALVAGVVWMVARSAFDAPPEPEPPPAVVVPPPTLTRVLPYPREVPPPPKPTVPAGYMPSADAVLHGEAPGPIYATRIVRTFGDERVVLRLVPGAAPFYVMENKVWNGLYERFARDKPGLAGEAWRLGGKADGADTGAANLAHPALRTTRAEAEACASWLGGRLPRAAQLDLAARFDNRVWTGGVAVGLRRTGPRPVGSSAGDRSLFGVNDLAGNGLEWTRDTLADGKLAVLRGRSYAASTPIDPATLKGELTMPQFPDAGSPYTGFRAVIELSAP